MYFCGTILTLIADEGPKTLFNLSEFDEITTMKVAISLMTALGLGDSQEQLNQLHGSFPVPGRQELALAYPFKVSAVNSSDPRIATHGRDATIFLVFNKENKKIIFKHYDLIEKTIQRSLKPIKNESNLSEAILKHIYITIEKLLTSAEGKEEDGPSQKEISNNLEQMKKERELEEIITKKTKEVETIQSKIDFLLNEMMVFTDPLIVEGALFMRPKIDSEKVKKLIPLTSKYVELIDSIGKLKEQSDAKQIDLNEIVDVNILIRIGNFFYWKGLLSGKIIEYKRAKEFYLRANQIKDDSIIWLSIGSIYNRMNRPEEAKDWISGGFVRMRERNESLKISKNMLFGDVFFSKKGDLSN